MSKGMVPSNPLVQRLHGKCGLHTRGYAPGECVLCDAADEIERLERENEELRFVGAGDFEDNQRLRAENSAKDRHMADYHTMHDEIERLRAALEKAEDKLLRTGNLHCRDESGATLRSRLRREVGALMTDRFIPLRCRMFGHLWKPSHISERIQPYGLRGWVYLEDVCQRCYTREYRMGSWAKDRDDYNRKRAPDPGQGRVGGATE